MVSMNPLTHLPTSVLSEHQSRSGPLLLDGALPPPVCLQLLIKLVCCPSTRLLLLSAPLLCYHVSVRAFKADLQLLLALTQPAALHNEVAVRGGDVLPGLVTGGVRDGLRVG